MKIHICTAFLSLSFNIQTPLTWLFYCNWPHSCLTPPFLSDMPLFAYRSYRPCNIKHKLSERKCCCINMYCYLFYCLVYGKKKKKKIHLLKQSVLLVLVTSLEKYSFSLSIICSLKSSNVTVGWDYSMVCRGLTVLQPALLVAQSCGAKIAWHEWKYQTVPCPQTGTFFPVKAQKSSATHGTTSQNKVAFLMKKANCLTGINRCLQPSTNTLNSPVTS